MGYSLSQYAMDFTARTSIKSQVLAYFIADWAPNVNEEENEERRKKPWKMYCDGAYYDEVVVASAVLMSPSSIEMRYAARLDFEGKSNNVAGYEGLLLGLRKARAIGAQRLIISIDSELITRQIGKTY